MISMEISNEEQTSDNGENTRDNSTNSINKFTNLKIYLMKNHKKKF